MELKIIEEQIKNEAHLIESLVDEMQKVIVGQEYLIDRMLITLICRSHLLLEGVPGLAKTLAVNTLSKALELSFKRIQFTPDLLPADLIGTLIYDPEKLEFTPKLGPLFSQIILADEINRAPAKVQSALLEAMQEKQVTIGDTTYQLPQPFLVMATQNPIEQEGTYPLPEAQVDRFMLKLKVEYPTRDQEKKILNKVALETPQEIKAVATEEDLRRIQKVVKNIYVDERIKDYIVNIIFATRDPESAGLTEMARLLDFGASPRATIFMIESARALAFMRNRGFVIPEDIKDIGYDILRHRLILSYEAEAEEMTSEDIIDKLFSQIEVP